MWQLMAVFISFLMIPLLIRLKVKLSYTLTITGLFLGIISGIGFEKFIGSIASLVTDQSSLNTILTVMMVSILGGLMKEYGFLDKIVEYLQQLIKDKKNILMIVPAMIGVLTIPGGAMLSAPFVYDIGEELDVKPSKRAAINLVFRHLSMFILPYSTAILLVVSAFPELDVLKFVGLNLIFVAAIVIIGNFVLLRDVESQKSESRKDIGKNLLNLALYTSPIYICVIVNAITGWPFYVTLFASVLIVYIVGNKKDFLKVAIKSLNWQTVLTIAAVLLMKAVILNMEDLLGLFNLLFSKTNNFFSVLLVLFVSGLFFGLITGSNMPPMAIMLPMIAQLNPSSEMLYVYIYFATASSFFGYYFSPLHLCQLFTLDIMKVSPGELYKEYRPYAGLLLVALFVSTYVVRLVLV